MVTVQNYGTPTNKIVVTGEPARVRYKNISTAANCYPGRIAVRGTTDYDIKCSDGLLPPIGIIGYEQAPDFYRFNSFTTIYALGDEVPVISGGGPTVYAPLGLAAGTYATEGDPLMSWSAGQYIPGASVGGKSAIKVPFKDSSGNPVDTGINLPAGIRVVDCVLKVTAGNAGGVTVSVGMLAAEGGSATGFLSSESCTALGYATHNLVDASANSITLGSYLYEGTIQADASGNFAAIRKAYVTDGTITSLTYTTSSAATLTGYILLVIESPGLKEVGKAGSTVDATTTAVTTAGGANVFVELTDI